MNRHAPTLAALLLAVAAAAPSAGQTEILDCEAARSAPLLPADPELCAELADAVRRPGALPLAEYEARLGDFLRNYCHRDAAAGWKRDKGVRDTGPFIATLTDGKWVGDYHGTHAPVVIWYSKEMLEWMAENRPPEASEAPAEATPVPDGAVMVKEMFPAPAAACVGVPDPADPDPTYLLPTSGAAVMVRDREASHDGWFWGWFGWSGWDPDWPAGPANRYPYMGFGQYCVNCHASAKNNFTFASLRHVEGEEGEPLVFLSQHFYDAEVEPDHHRLVALPSDDAPRLGEPLYVYNAAFTDAVRADSLPKPTWGSVSRMPSETYDNVWVEAGGPTLASQFLTSDQCLGCHDAGGTGLQFDMTMPNPHGDNLFNLSPYATWRTSPMGLGGRDPIFYAQLASETETFHPDLSDVIQDTCLGCHGILGQRQFAIDQFEDTGECFVLPAGEKMKPGGEPFRREYANAVPWPDGNPQAELADFGALARDGISCTACHHMLVGQGADHPAAGEPQNVCVVRERMPFLNPDNEGFARTFTGSFLVGSPAELYGPFADPKTKPMAASLGIRPVHDAAVQSSELCGTCHTVHLPVVYGGKILGYTYEQTTYPEWAFSAYRTGKTADGGELPHGEGKLKESCQSCHMPSVDDGGRPFRSKIASIQEYGNFPQAEYNLGPEDLDLAVREGFARHTLVGLNVFFVKMAQQFPDVLGIRTQDPMLVSKGLDPLLFTEQAMLDQASNGTARIAIRDLATAGGKLSATVTVTSDVGHKFPSGVGFRRAFIELAVLDEAGSVLWASGRTNGAGVLVDENGAALPGELWWKDDCSGLRYPERLVCQPHYQKITRQDQVQIYQELVTAPAGEDPQCGTEAPKKTCGDAVAPGGHFTTSFLSICNHVKDNRLLPHGFLPLADRFEIAEALGAGADLARDSGSHGQDVENDPDYEQGGGDSLVYEIDLAGLAGRAAAVKATLYYQAIPPYYLQDRFCTSKSKDTQRLYFLAGHLNLEGTEAESWKLEVVSTDPVALP